jgi:hypothetical protein
VASTFISLPAQTVSVGSVQITDGTDTLAINNDGSINVALTGGGVTAVTYNEVTSVASSTLTTVATFVAGSSVKLRRASASGSNIAYFIVTVNGSTVAKKYTYYGGDLSVEFDFEDGIALTAADTVLVRVEHTRTMTGDFNATIITQG